MFIPSKKVHNEYGDFDSVPEWQCYEQKILPLINSGKAFDLKLHQSYEIIPRLVKKEYVQLKTKVKEVERVIERAAEYTCDFQYSVQTEQGIRIFIVEFKSSFSAQARDYPLRRKLIKRKIMEWNEQVGWDKWVFIEYKETDLIKPPKKERKKKTKK